MKKQKKSETKLTFTATTVKRMDMAQATGGMMNGGGGGHITGVVCTLTCGCGTAYTAAQSCCFTC
jgi:hypothetical protein